jgi:hypothetical protein
VRAVDWDKMAHALKMGTIFSQKILSPRKGFAEFGGILTCNIFTTLALNMQGKGSNTQIGPTPSIT